MKKKIMAVLLSLAMVSSAVPEVVTYAADTMVEATVTEADPAESDQTDIVEGEELSEDVISEEQLEESSLAGSEDINSDEEIIADADSVDAEITDSGEVLENSEEGLEDSEEEEILSDENYYYKKISDTEVAVTGIAAEEIDTLTIPSEFMLGEEIYSVTAVEKDALNDAAADTLTIPATVTSFGGQVLPGLREIFVSEENTSYEVKEGVLFTKVSEGEKASLILYPAASDAESYVVPQNTGVIAEKAFAKAANLKVLVLTDGIGRIEKEAVLTAANSLEIAFAYYENPYEVSENAFVLDGADANVMYFRSEEALTALDEIQPAFVYSPAMYDENGEPVEDYSASLSFVTEGLPENIEALINSASGDEKELDEFPEDESVSEESVPADESLADTSLSDDSLPTDSSLSDVPKDETLAEEAIVGAGPSSLDAKIASGFYSIKIQSGGTKYIKIKEASVKDAAASCITTFSLDLGCTMKIVPLGDSTYKIIASCSNKALTLSADAADNVAVIQKSYTGEDNQKWYIRETSTGVYTFLPYTDDSYSIDTKGQKTAAGTDVVITKNSESSTQGWKLVKRPDPEKEHLENGIYKISSELDSNKVLDVSAASKSAGANVQLYTSNGTAAQQFILRYLGYGNLYRIINVNSNKALDTTGSRTINTANVQQSNQSSSSTTQLWRIVKNSAGKYVVYNAGADRVLDVKNASASNGTNIQIYRWNNTKAQKWNFTKVSGTTAVDADGKDAEITAGWYTLNSARTSRLIAVKDSSLKDNANILLQKPGLGENNYFYIEPVGNEKYEIKAFCSDKVLSCVWGGDSKDAGNVVQKTDSGLSTQRWYIRISKKNKDYCSIVSSSDQNYVFTLKNNDYKFGTSVTVALSTGLNGQRWKIKSISNPNLKIPYDNTTYKIGAASNSKFVVSTEGQSKKIQANVQLMTRVNGAGEFWDFHKVGYGNLYTITNAYTGLALDAKAGGTSDGTNIWQYTANGTNAQLWRVMPTDSTKKEFVIINAVSNKALDVNAGTIAAGSNIQLYSQNGTDAQKWVLSRADINTFIPLNTAVTIRMKYNTARLVEVKNGDTTNGATVQLYAERGNTDQSFIITKPSDGYYRIRNVASKKYIGAKSTESGAAVLSLAGSSSDYMKWEIKATGDKDASFYFINKASGLALTGGYSNNSPFTLLEYKKWQRQKFYFDTPVIKTGWQQVGSNWRYYDNYGNCYRDTFLEDGKYYFDSNGNVLTGWKKYGAYYYYFKGKDGREYTDNRPYLGGLFGLTGSKYNSQTRPNCSYYYTIDTARCVVTWYTKYPGTSDWNLPVCAFLCSPGTDSTPTDPGGRKTGYNKEWIPLMGPSYGQYGTEIKAWTYIAGTSIIDWTNNGEFFHSVACGAANTHNLNPNTYNLLGTRQSHGCVRLGVRNAYWIYNFVDSGTMGQCSVNLAAPIKTLPQAWAITTIDPTDPHYTGNWAYIDSYATAYTNGAYIPRG